MSTITLSLPDALQAFVDAQVAARGDGNVNAYLLELIEAAQTKTQNARLEDLLREGLATSGAPLDAAFRARLERAVEDSIGAPA